MRREGINDEIDGTRLDMSGKELTVIRDHYFRPIHDAIESGNLEMVKLLMSHGADPLAEIGEKTPLEFALSNDQKEIHAFLECKLIYVDMCTSVHPTDYIEQYLHIQCMEPLTHWDL